MTPARALALALAGLCACGSDPAPRLDHSDPMVARSDRDTRIAIFGDGFVASVTANAGSGARSVDDHFQATLGGLALTEVTRVSPTEVDATCPAGAPLGTADLVVTDPRGRSARLPGFMVVDSASQPPRVVFQAPAADASFPPDTTVHVSLFARAAAGGLLTDLSFAADSGSPPTFQSIVDPPTIEASAELDFRMPTGLPVGTTVTLTARAHDDAAVPNLGQATLLLHVAAPTPGPHLYSITPARGPTTGGQDVVILGENFTAQTQLQLDGLALAAPVFVSDGELHGQTPPHPGVGRVALSAHDALGDETLPDAYEYATPPLVVAIEPNLGPEAGGTAVTVVGYGFDASTVVELGSARLASPMLVSARSLKGLTPPGTGIVDVVLLGAAGTPTDRLVMGFRYWPNLTLTNVKPAQGMPGRTVKLTGSGFTPDMTVRFGSTLATGLAVQNAGKAQVDAPVGTGTVDVTVANPVSVATQPGAFSYR